MKREYETALIARKARAFKERYGQWGGMLLPGAGMACEWMKLAIVRLTNMGEWEEAEEIKSIYFRGAVSTIYMRDFFITKTKLEIFK